MNRLIVAFLRWLEPERARMVDAILSDRRTAHDFNEAAKTSMAC